MPHPSKQNRPIKENRVSLIRNPLLNKGSAFSEKERDLFQLNGLIPAQVETIEIQADRCYQQYKEQQTDLDRYIFLRALQDENETLFFYLAAHHITEMMPILYTPTVGSACQTYSHLFQKNRGLFIAYPDRDKIGEILKQTEQDNVKIIVVTDGERILGLGDLGVGGMGIPIGKLALYTACGGIDPETVLPIVLDVGTNNEKLLNDPFYMGWHHKRITGDEYYSFVDQFVQAVMQQWPDIFLHFEDFAQKNALPLLKKYRDQYCCFNDDIQGTSAVALATLYSACKTRKTSIKDQRIVFLGAGSAGCGIAEQIVSAMVAEGLDEITARGQIYMVDRNGLITDDMQDIPDFQKKLAQPLSKLKNWEVSEHGFSLLEVVRQSQATVLVGVSGQKGLFTEEVIKTLASHCEAPFVMPLSNPTSHMEATPEDILKWTNGKALVATGSPFAPVVISGNSFPIAQCNNAYIFPGIGLGVLASKATRVTDNMMVAAAYALADTAPSARNEGTAILPSFDDIEDVSYVIALAVAKAAVEDNVAEKKDDKELLSLIKDYYWHPEYSTYHVA
ncbi:MAG: NAD-dependent malic enzyme [Zymomonas mobilis]|uniref:malate dehydrogenase (oxaloacetate-decarboxylating) n=1 Tax=Zymomonas mobilis TaxID=542 RepID=A0A542VYY3_ZYMMB|nr:NAD-dependent malic enzyme [Zymomonas mobilis]TQL16538.1 NAD-dependent malic enzyme [Zymomonas mobilis]